jgi:poly(A)-specific ribonuclease
MYRSAQKFLVSQFGLSTFKCVDGQYTAKTYNFNIFPRQFMNFDKRFACQASSLEFLTEHKFDFNKFIYEGVGYLSLEQQTSMKEVRIPNSLVQFEMNYDLKRKKTLHDDFNL